MKIKRLGMIALILVLFSGTVSAAILPDYEAEKGWVASCPGVGEQQDTWRFFTCNCTSYVAWRLNQEWRSITNNNSDIHFWNYYRGSNFNTPTGGWSNAEYWKANAQSLGIVVDSTPTVGSLAWWAESGSRPDGHIAFVERIDSQGKVCLSEYNADDDLKYRNDRCVSPSSVSGFIHMTAAHLEYIKTVRPGTDEYNEVVLHQMECQDSGLCLASGEGGNSPPLSDVTVNRTWLTNMAGETKTTFSPGESVQAKAQFKNKGAGNFTTAITVKFYRSNGYKVDANKQEVGDGTIQPSSLTTGNTHTETETFIVPTTPGTYNIQACGDTGKVVSELHEGNNCGLVVFKVDDFAWLIPILNLILED